MNGDQGKHLKINLGALIFLIVAILALGLQSCQTYQPDSEVSPLQPTSTALTPDPNQLSVPDAPEEGTPTAASSSEMGDQPVWEDFPPPSIDPATAIPPPIRDLSISKEVLIWVLLGSDTEPPFVGRTEAIHLVIIHPRFAKASLVSIPGDLYVYIPGYTMQRLNTAYALGGVETLRRTLEYNFGLRPSRFVLAHPGDFQWLVDDLQGIDVTVFQPMPQACGGIRAGLVPMDGSLALCYASFREGMDEVDRMRRQQQLLRLIFQKLANDGNLIQLPVLYASYEGWVITDLSLTELMGLVPLALRLADLDRIGYYMIGWEQMQLWEIPGYSQVQVFLPDQESMMALLQQALDDVMIPEPQTNLVQTLEAQITAAYQATLSNQATSITATLPVQTPTLPVEPYQLATATPTPTPQGYPYPDDQHPGYP
ncbi:MAG: LCP family protein [Brevefilum sp.]|jgi:LCP family protein required for cell wall assembly